MQELIIENLQIQRDFQPQLQLRLYTPGGNDARLYCQKYFQMQMFENFLFLTTKKNINFQ